jgi:RecB family exonuclease
MMQIVYFSQKEQFLTEMESVEGFKEYIAPSPAKADSLRGRLLVHDSQDVITIAKFTSNLVNELWGDTDLPQVKRKSELLLIFGILKNKYLPDLGFEQFTQAYNLFSDLRSFTMNEEALSSVLDEQPEVIKHAVNLFWKLLELTNYLDEHGAYKEIAEKLRSSEEKDELKKTYIFWGFQHLNGQQVDLLKALSIRYDVVIPFPLSLKEKLKKSDWISWLKDSRVKERELELKVSQLEAKWIPINSREIALQLKDLLKTGDQIILGVSKLSPLHMDIVPSKDLSFKIPHQLVAAEIKEIGKEIKGFVGSVIDLSQWFKEAATKSKSLKQLKSIQLYQEAVDSILEMTDDEIIVDRFFLKLLLEVVNLNQPRTSYVSVAPYDMSMDLKDMSSLEDIDRKRRVILCIDERFDDIQGLGQNYTESIQKSLAVLGPLKRNELELLFKQWEFRDLFSQADVTVLMGDGTLKHSLIWKRLFTDINLIKNEVNKEVPMRQVKDHLKLIDPKEFKSTFSASKIQAFIDCPRKFYYSYVDKVFPRIILEKDFDPMTSGTMIHKIIEVFFKNNLADEDLKRITSEVMQSHIKEKNLQLPKEVTLQKELIFNHRAMNGIEFTRKLEEVASEKITWKIEESFKLENEFVLNGQIDCIGISDSYIFLLDFKSTSGSAATGTQVDTYEAIQLWAYAYASRTLIPDFETKTIILGYVVLDNASESHLMTSDEDLAKVIRASKLCSIHKFKEPFLEKLKEVQEKMLSLTAAIATEKEFKASPKNGTCTFCELNKVCVKSEILHV